MKHQFKLLAAAAALAVSGFAAAAPTAAHSGGHAIVVHKAQASAAVLYNQTDSDSGTGISSQNFESTYDAYDNQAADDFVVPSGTKWTVTEVDVAGSDWGVEASSMHVTFYKAKNGKPGAMVKDYPTAAIMSYNGSGGYAIKVPKTKLKPGTYFVSVQANLDFATGGQWYWETSTAQHNSDAVWQNPGDGFGTGCTTWGDMLTCVNYGPDLIFTLSGSAK